MAALKGAKPAPARPGNELRLNPCIAAWNSFELTQNASEIQEQRAAWLVRRYRLAPFMAVAVAGLAFSTREATR